MATWTYQRSSAVRQNGRAFFDYFGEVLVPRFAAAASGRNSRLALSRALATIGATRFELATSRSRTVRSIQAELRPVNACSFDLSDLAGSVNSINLRSMWTDEQASTSGHDRGRAVPVVFAPFS